MKALNFFLIILLFLAFSACTTTQKEETFFLGLEFKEKQALFHKTTISNSDEKKIDERITVTIIQKNYAEFSELKTILLSYNSIDENNIKDLCFSLPKEKKQSTVKMYFNGTIDTGTSIKVNYFFPLKNLKLKDSWEYGGITYSIESKEKFNSKLGSFNALKISFKGKREFAALNNALVNVNGFIFFDFENKRILKSVEIASLGTTIYTITNELIDIKNNFNETDLNYACLNAKP